MELNELLNGRDAMWKGSNINAVRGRFSSQETPSTRVISQNVMSPEQDILKENVDFLITSLKSVDSLTVILFKAKVISQVDRKEILQSREEKERKEVFVEKLTTLVDSATFGTFLDALQKTGQEELSESLKKQLGMHQVAQHVAWLS
ncbi:unnamed protein product [Darwinula stevensoni]|uniref:CARD domain-containing protein n=1 Tax=Darwinula stevensoni TaxID=69355 RepID=A0A7R9AGA7_9CRUS|nr:unnamed protein product [Darwinula stevensoni]CAG0904129.1 unnamed protein product [Darwinula stevensoni]